MSTNNSHKDTFTLRSLTVLKGRGIKTLVVQDDAVQDADKIQAWVDKHTVTGGPLWSEQDNCCFVNPDWFTTPEGSLLVRELEPGGVDFLLEEFCKGIFNLKITVLVWSDVPSFSTQYTQSSFLVDPSAAAPPRPFQAIGGNHSAHAMKKGKKTFPLKKIFQKAKCRIILCPRTPENIEMALLFGNLDNRAAQSVVKTSQISVVRMFRRQLAVIQANNMLTDEEKKTKFAKFKKDIAPQIPFTHNTMHTFSALCSLSEPVFSRMDKIFRGEYVKNNNLSQKTPDAMTHFTNMSGIPDDDLCKWLQRVIDGEWTTATFNQRCVHHKKTTRVMDQIMEYVNILKPTANFSAWSDLVKAYPMCDDGQWFDGILNACPDAVKALLPPVCKGIIDTMVQIQDRANNAPPVSNGLCVMFDFVF